MKKQLFYLVALVLLISSCGEGGNEGNTTGSDSTEAQALLSAPDTNNLAVVQAGDCDTSDMCFKDQQCQDTACQNMIVACHSITEAEFNTMTQAYHDPIVKIGEYTIGTLNALMTGLNCANGDHLGYSDATGTIVLSKVAGKISTLKGKFSLAFLRGMIRQNHAASTDKLEFYKGTKDTGETLCLRLNKGGTIVFWSDLSEIYP
jgi:hypothetical protein